MKKSVKVSGYSRARVKLKSTGNLWKSILKINWHSQQEGKFYILFLEKPITYIAKVVHEISHLILQIEWNILKLDWVFKIYSWRINRTYNLPSKSKKKKKINNKNFIIKFSIIINIRHFNFYLKIIFHKALFGIIFYLYSRFKKLFMCLYLCVFGWSWTSIKKYCWWKISQLKL